jgi:hypothetical protein
MFGLLGIRGLRLSLSLKNENNPWIEQEILVTVTSDSELLLIPVQARAVRK